MKKLFTFLMLTLILPFLKDFSINDCGREAMLFLIHLSIRIPE